MQRMTRNWRGILFFQFTVAGLVWGGSGCRVPDQPCPPADPGTVVTATEPVHVSSGDPYAAGPFTVQTYDIARCEQGAPRPMQIHAPAEPGTYAVVVFQHGLLLSSAYYSEILRHLASHGFVVVAPQMYAPGGLPIGLPTSVEESQQVEAILDWLPSHVSQITGVTADTNTLGMAGHSRGGRVVWLVLSRDASRAMAVAGVDPVDGTFDGTDRVVQGAFEFDFPSLVFGAGIDADPGQGFSCSPDGDNHVQFYQASPSPAWYVVALEGGHLDMLDALVPGCGIICDVCWTGPDPAAIRTLTAGLLTAFFRGSLQGDSSAYAYLTDTQSAPSPVAVDSR